MSTLAPHLAVRITVAEPTVVGSLAVFPLIADRSPSVRYISFAEAVQRGATVKELAAGASVNDLVVHNPLDVPVLVYEGEEVLGAQQNRAFDVSALAAANSTLTVPVSCVEAGRWDGARHDESFVPAPQTANPRLRQMKNTQARASLAAGMEARAVQGEVWREVAETAGRHGVNSRTGAMHDVFERRREQLETVTRAVETHCGQVGMLAAIGGRFVGPIRREVHQGCDSRLFTPSVAFAPNGRARLLLFPPEGGLLTTRQASLNAADRLVAPPEGLLTLGFDPARFQTEPPACYRASWQLPGRDSHPLATTSLCWITIYISALQLWAHPREVASC